MENADNAIVGALFNHYNHQIPRIQLRYSSCTWICHCLSYVSLPSFILTISPDYMVFLRHLFHS